MKLRIFILLFSMVQIALAQQFTVSSQLDSASIQIGEQARLRLSVAQPTNLQVSIPILSDTITKGIEIVEMVKADTISLSDSRIQVNYDYLITSFDSGFYFIPSYTYAAAGDTLQTAPLGLSVTTVTVNPETDDVKAIKPIMDAPFYWSELFTWVGYFLLAFLVVSLIIFVLLKYVFKKKVPFIDQTPQPVIPPHIVALEKLEEIKVQKIWQCGDIKVFYTQVTDVLRVYLEGRFGINAMELTSDEIMALVKKEPGLNEVRAALKDLLTLADLVKFAKMVPIENQNERSLLIAFDVVDKTKPVEEPEVTSQ
ncbi:MAG: hypothetical protein UHZ06_07185 [Paludibacteraceae bacterium]|nr:hypothetical protein [Paludibacteraceae bacterium]